MDGNATARPAILVSTRTAARRLGGADALAASARTHKALRRKRGIKDAWTLLRLAFMSGPGRCPLRPASAIAAAHGLAEVSNVALLNRLKAAAPWLEALCQTYLTDAAKAITPDTDDALAAIRLIDASLIDGPGKQVWRLRMCSHRRPAASSRST